MQYLCSYAMMSLPLIYALIQGRYIVNINNRSHGYHKEFRPDEIPGKVDIIQISWAPNRASFRYQFYFMEIGMLLKSSHGNPIPWHQDIMIVTQSMPFLEQFWTCAIAITLLPCGLKQTRVYVEIGLQSKHHQRKWFYCHIVVDHVLLPRLMNLMGLCTTYEIICTNIRYPVRPSLSAFFSIP